MKITCPMCNGDKKDPYGVPGNPCPRCAGTGCEDALLIREFSDMNLARCTAKNGFNHALDSWSLSDWMTAVMGELGEAANVVKKLNRVRDGIPGNKETEEELKKKLRKELADTYIYLDLMMQLIGDYNTEADILEVFHAKSKEIGYVPKGDK